MKDTEIVLGSCPACGGKVYLHESEDYIICERVFKKECCFTLNRYYLKRWGKHSISINGFKHLLLGNIIRINDLRDPKTQIPLYKPAIIQLKYVDAIGKYGIDVKVFHDESS